MTTTRTQPAPAEAAALYREHARALRAWLRGRLSDPALVDDVLQDTFVSALRAGLPEGPPGPWLFGIARNKTLKLLRDRKPVGDRVAIIGAGGIGFDVAELLTHGETHGPDSIKDFGRDWGVDTNPATPGGLGKPAPRPAARQVQLLQRKAGRPGAGLGKTTGWIHRAALQARGVTMTGGVTYERIDDDGLVVTAGGETRVIPADSVVICAGQEPERSLAAALEAAGCTVHLIGGADLALELDAKRAIDQGTRLAATF